MKKVNILCVIVLLPFVFTLNTLGESLNDSTGYLNEYNRLIETRVDNFIQKFIIELNKDRKTELNPGIKVSGVYCNNEIDLEFIKKYLPRINNLKLQYKVGDYIKKQWCDSCEKIMPMGYTFEKYYNDTNFKYFTWVIIINENLYLYTFEINRPRERGFDHYFVKYDSNNTIIKTDYSTLQY